MLKTSVEKCSEAVEKISVLKTWLKKCYELVLEVSVLNILLEKFFIAVLEVLLPNRYCWENVSKHLSWSQYYTYTCYNKETEKVSV